MMFNAVEIVTTLSGIAAVIVIAWNKIQSLKMPSLGPKEKAEGELIAHMKGAMDAALAQRDLERAGAETARLRSAELEAQLREVQKEFEGMNQRIMLLTELNTRLVTKLDEARLKIEEYLSASPQPEQVETEPS